MRPRASPIEQGRFGWVRVTTELLEINVQTGRIPTEGSSGSGTREKVIEILNSANRPHLGLMMNDLGQVMLIGAWSYHAGVKYAGHVADYELESIGISTARS